MKTSEVVQHVVTEMGSAILSETEFLTEHTLEITNEGIKTALSMLRRTPDPGYEVLMDLTGVDYLEPFPRTKVVYWLHNPSNYTRIRLFTYVARGGSLHTVTDIWEGADWYERELFDLFGIKFIEHPDLKRILMPDDWKGHPLLRDYALTEESVEFKNNVKPKIPSQIIPYVKSNKKS